MENFGNTVIVRLRHSHTETVGPLSRTTGFVRVGDMIDLITTEEMEANPRHSKRSNITKDIMETLETSPEMMAFYSKGLLIGAAEVEERDRSRFQLTFLDRAREGILDGGHNTLAIGITLLELAGVPLKETRGIKIWNDLKEVWNAHLAEIKKLKGVTDNPTLDALVPVEILTARAADEASEMNFSDTILNICANRNQNAQLSAEALANQAGMFDFLKASLPEDIVKEVSWRTNDGGRLDPRALAALAWVTLGKAPNLEKYKVTPLPGQIAYSGKAQALSRFTSLMESPATERTNDGKSYVVVDEGVASAFEMLPEVFACYDIIYKGYKDAYNNGGGKFGRINAVQRESKKVNKTLFSQEEFSHEVPPLGYLYPVVFSLQALIKVNKNTQRLEWLVDPVEFFSDAKNLANIVGALKPIIEMAEWDPQKVGKGEASYTSAREKARNMVLEAMLG
nr:AIPR family protein [Corynebacterium lactis]